MPIHLPNKGRNSSYYPSEKIDNALFLIKMIEKLTEIIKEEKSLIQNSFFVFFGTAAGGFIGMITAIALSRILGPHDFGVFKTLTAFFGFFIYLFDFGFQNTLMKYISRYTSAGRKNKIRELIQSLFFFRLIVLVPIVIFSLISKDDIARILLRNQEFSYLIYPAAVYLIISFSDLTRPILIGLQNFRLFSAVNIIVPFASLLILIPSALYLGLPTVIIGFGIAHFIGSLISFGYLINKNYIIKPGKKVFRLPKLIFSYGLPSYFSSIPSYLFFAIIPLLSLFFKQTEIGYYSFALSFYSVAMIVPIGISQILFPKISSYSENDNRKAVITLKKTLLIYGLVSISEIIGVL